MTTQVHVPVEHAIGAHGLVVLKIPSGGITVHGSDGDVVRFSSPVGRDIAEDYKITPGDGRVDVSMHDSWGLGLGWLGGRRSGPIEVEMPRTASLWVDTASGTVNVVAMRGEQRYRAASGSLDLRDAAGPITVDQVSGDVKIRASGAIRLDARTVSGEIRASAPAFERLVARLMSGDVRIAGRLGGDGPFAVESVSGDVTLELDGPVRIEGSTISGRIRTDLPHREGGRAGRRTVEIGEGGVQVLFKTVSGDLTVHGLRPARGPEPASAPASVAPVEPEPAATAGPATMASVEPEPTGTTGPATMATVEPEPTASAGAATIASAEPPPVDVAPAGQALSAAEPTSSPATAAAAGEPLAAERMAILRDLEDGRIGVDEASKKLAELDATEERSKSHSRTFGIGPIHGELRWDHRA